MPGPIKPDVIPDPGLVSAYRNGDEGAAAELIRRHAQPLARFLYSLGAGQDEVDDLVQETLFRAFRRIESWRGGATFRTWLFSIGSNALRDLYRRQKPTQIVSLEDYDAPAGSNPETEYAATETEQRVRQGIAGLPRLQREVFLLRAQGDTGYDEIAVALGTTPGAARVHYHNAVKRLKELLR
jgi:RNA polymerase sigma-70 factor (ECF subfamily)